MLSIALTPHALVYFKLPKTISDEGQQQGLQITDIDEAPDATDFDKNIELSHEELEQLNHRIKDDNLRRFFKSLNEERLLDLARRVEVTNDQFIKGTIGVPDGICLWLGPNQDRGTPLMLPANPITKTTRDFRI